MLITGEEQLDGAVRSIHQRDKTLKLQEQITAVKMRIKPGFQHFKPFTKEMLSDYLETIRINKL